MKDRILSIRLEQSRLDAFDAVARRRGMNRNELFDLLVDLAIHQAPDTGWTCRTVLLSGKEVVLTGVLDPSGDAGYSTEMALPNEAWAYLEHEDG